jgi:beta-N-acetylhexosaminidase
MGLFSVTCAPVNTLMKKPFFYIFLFFGLHASAQYNSALPEKQWVDSVFRSLSKEQKIAQLMVIRAHSNLGAEHVKGVVDLITKYNIGALCFFQGGPVRQALLTNRYQSLAKTPLLMTIDGEWGLGMRLDSVTKYPFQLTLGALPDDHLMYQMGVSVGKQMARMGVHVNYAPVLDINNNPANPVIGYRSFGEEREKVARLGLAYIRGMQEAGIMACAKHFPGHGDTDVDSHADLPVISKSKAQLDSLELYPFQQAVKGGVGSVMIGHLSIPAIDGRANVPTSLSKKAITGLLRGDLHFDGLTFTDALEMKGVTKHYPAGEAAVQALLAGNDMLCLPENFNAAMNAIKAAIRKKAVKWKDIDAKVRKVLTAKYRLGLNHQQVVDTTNLLNDLNRETGAVKKTIARNTVTVLHNNANFFPFAPDKRIAYVSLGAAADNDFGRRLMQDFKADTFSFGYKNDRAKATRILQSLDSARYDAVLIGVHNYSYRPGNNYGISAAAIALWDSLQRHTAATFLFGNIYAAKAFCAAKTLVALHQDDAEFQQAAADFLRGSLTAIGRVPVSVCDIRYGSSMALNNLAPAGATAAWLKIDSIVRSGLDRKAYPGAVVIAVQDGRIKYHKAFGHYEFDPASRPVTLESIYDLASVTKTSATTVAAMKLYEDGKLDLDKTLGDYLPLATGTNKAPLKIRDILLHQAGLSAFISFYKETIDAGTGKPSETLYSSTRDTLFTIPVAQGVWLRRDWNDTMLHRIMQSPLGPPGKYVYSDNDFILLGKIVERLTGTTLDQYVQHTFYTPMIMTTTGFRAAQRFGLERIVPTEQERYFRRQLLQGYVHDEGAAMFGNISGHAGLFSNAYDLALLYQMLLNGGSLNGERYLKPETVSLFTSYNSDISRRGLGFDKPEKDNATRSDPYPSRFASPETFGHTGFTGTCVWVDPKEKLVYIFLSNRVYNTRSNNLLSQLGIRSKIQDAIYEALRKEAPAQQPTTAKGF